MSIEKFKAPNPFAEAYWRDRERQADRAMIGELRAAYAVGLAGGIAPKRLPDGAADGISARKRGNALPMISFGAYAGAVGRSPKRQTKLLRKR